MPQPRFLRMRPMPVDVTVDQMAGPVVSRDGQGWITAAEAQETSTVESCYESVPAAARGYNPDAEPREPFSGVPLASNAHKVIVLDGNTERCGWVAAHFRVPYVIMRHTEDLSAILEVTRYSHIIIGDQLDGVPDLRAMVRSWLYSRSRNAPWWVWSDTSGNFDALFNAVSAESPDSIVYIVRVEFSSSYATRLLEADGIVYG